MSRARSPRADRTRGRGPAVPEAGERLQKVLARTGLGSRRQVESWIAEGRITVNGQVAALGARVARGDRVAVDGRRVTLGGAQRLRVLAYHKPGGEVCTRSDPEGRPTVFDHLPAAGGGRWVSVGRLDVNTQGLLLFTNAGELAHRLMHPSSGVEREYAVRVLGTVTGAALRALTEGVPLEGKTARFETVRAAGGEGANRWYHVTLLEGRHREVHRLWESQGLRVSRLIRVRYGPIALPRDLAAGRWRRLTEEQCGLLIEVAGLSAQVPAHPTGRDRGRGRRSRGKAERG